MTDCGRRRASGIGRSLRLHSAPLRPRRVLSIGLMGMPPRLGACSAPAARGGGAAPADDGGEFLRSASTDSSTGSPSSSGSSSGSHSSEGDSSGGESRTSVAPGMLGPLPSGRWNTQGPSSGHRLDGPSMPPFRRRLRWHRLLAGRMVVFLQETRATRAEAAILGSHFLGITLPWGHTSLGLEPAGGCRRWYLGILRRRRAPVLRYTSEAGARLDSLNIYLTHIAQAGDPARPYSPMDPTKVAVGDSDCRRRHLC